MLLCYVWWSNYLFLIGLCHRSELLHDWKLLSKRDPHILENRLIAYHNLGFININFKQLVLDMTGRTLRVLKEVECIVWSQYFWCWGLFFSQAYCLNSFHLFFFNNRFYSWMYIVILCLIPPLLWSNLSFQLISKVFR